MGISTTPSWGERMLPYLFTGMETCCFDVFLIGLASMHVLGSNIPLLPLWASFVLIASSCWFIRFCERFKLLSLKISVRDFINVAVFGIVAVGTAVLALPWLLQLDLNHAIAAFF
ncbi:MAG: hypothetical protein ABI406_17185, partial [Ktedonobacteraceae bacterium]